MKYPDGVNTSSDATNAADDFAKAGYKSYYNTSSTKDYIEGNNPNTGKKRLESEIC